MSFALPQSSQQIPFQSGIYPTIIGTIDCLPRPGLTLGLDSRGMSLFGPI